MRKSTSWYQSRSRSQLAEQLATTYELSDVLSYTPHTASYSSSLKSPAVLASAKILTRRFRFLDHASLSRCKVRLSPELTQTVKTLFPFAENFSTGHTLS